MRYAAYVRISSEEQVGNFSLDAQKRAIEAWVKAQSGRLVKVYVDEAQSGRSADRPEFQALRRDAKKNSFDAIVVHKFDRFARNRTDALAIKSLLRHDYGIKVFSVTEPSEDSDGAIGALIEGIMESVADWYSRNLSNETTKGKHERALQGYHNNRPPFGYDKSSEGILIPNPQERIGLRLAFERYATGEYSDKAIAQMLNDKGYVSKQQCPFNADSIRAILQNRTYLGYVKYQQYDQHSDGRRSRRKPIEWIKGHHDPLIEETVFHRCQEIRHARATFTQYRPKYRTYLLRELVYCAECVGHRPAHVPDKNYGKMRPHSNTQGRHTYYRCRARDFGRACSQNSIRAEIVEEQVIHVLNTLNPLADWRDHWLQGLGELLGDQHLETRVAEIKQVIERMDFRWDHGFFTDQETYLAERVKLQEALEQLTPIPDDELQQAADMLENFAVYWQALEGDGPAQEELIKHMVARVWVKHDRVVAISLHPSYHIPLALGNKKPTAIAVDWEKSSFVPDRKRRDSNPRSLP